MNVIHVDDDETVMPQLETWFKEFRTRLTELGSLAWQDTASDARIGNTITNDDEDDNVVRSWATIAKERQIDVDSLEYSAMYNEDDFWKQIEIARANATPPSLILLDLNLLKDEPPNPNPTGLQLLQKIRGDTFFASTPVIVLSTHNSKNTIEKCYANGANAYVVKGGIDELKNRFLAVLTHWSTIVVLVR